MVTKKIIVGVSGASGVEMSFTLLKELKTANYEIHLIVTKGALTTWDFESDMHISKLYEMSDFIYDNNDFSAKIASGSFYVDGLIIMPCSMKTLAGIVSGFTENLLLRAADVCLKESRKVVLVPREMPFGKLHLKNLYSASDLGCIIVPPVLTFYNKPRSVQDHINHIVAKVLMQYNIQIKNFIPW